MSLTAGSRLGPYEVLAPIGAGGMGEVYRARDTRLNRTVALKILPAELAGDLERRARFEREAHAIAALSHPHICTIHDVGRENGTDYLVMELLEGETLAERLGRAKARPLPMADVLRYAIEISDALDKAHRAGIVHRDLKPANIMLTKSGAKLLDFGLAKLKGPAVPISMTAIEHATTTGPKTATGTILGTIHYMAPEQVEGREADTRSDIWALGVVIYEMSTGARPFDGESPASVIGAILKDSPAAISSRQPLAPPALDYLVERCLEKDPDERWHNAGDLKRSLSGLRATSTYVLPTASPRLGRSFVAFGVAALLVIGLAGGAAWRYGGSTAEPSHSARFEVFPPPGVSLSPSPVASATMLALSPDGRNLAFIAAQRHGSSQLWVRPIDEVIARPLAGTEGAFYPFWSPDGRSIGFFTTAKLKKIDLAGGSPQTICDVVSGRGGTWGPDGTIVFSGSAYSPLLKISAAGGNVVPATSFSAGQEIVSHYWPEFLSDGRHFLYYQRSAKPEFEGIFVGSLDSTATTTTRLLEVHARAVPAGHQIFYVREGALLVQDFNEATMRVGGEPIRLGDDIGYFQSSYGYAAITAADRMVAFGPTVAPTVTVEWRDRTGTRVDAPLASGVYSGLRLSPDGQSLAVSLRDTGSQSADIWVLDLVHGTPRRWTTDPFNDWFPTWSSDGRGLFFGSTREGTTNVFQKIGVGPEERLMEMPLSGAARYPSDVSIDGKTLLVMASSTNGYDLAWTRPDAPRQLTPFLSKPFNEIQGRFSPNQRWVAYASDESGAFEIYVRPYPAADSQWRISTAGGTEPEWRRDGKELFYVAADGKLMAVNVTSDSASFEAATPHPLFDAGLPEAVPPYPGHYAVAPGGQRFLIGAEVEPSIRRAITVILNWPAAGRAK